MGTKKQTRPQWSNKQPHQGTACRRGEPIYYEEIKKGINLSLTPTAVNKLTELAIHLNISRSEVVERWLRGLDLAASEAEGELNNQVTQQREPDNQVGYQLKAGQEGWE